jgi:hypothetical protein
MAGCIKSASFSNGHKTDSVANAVGNFGDTLRSAWLTHHAKSLYSPSIYASLGTGLSHRMAFQHLDMVFPKLCSYCQTMYMKVARLSPCVCMMPNC